MGFKQEYIKTVKHEESYKLPRENETILPFLGYAYRRETTSTKRWHDGGYSITQTGSDTYKVKKNPNYSDTYYYDNAIFYRDFFPDSARSALEDRIYEKLENEYVSKGENGHKEFDPFKTPYLGMSAKEYYERKACPDCLLDWLLFPVIIVGIIIIIISFLKLKFLLLFGTLGIGLLYLVVWALVNESRSKKYLKAHPYYSLTSEERENWRQKYLNSLSVCAGDKELDALIKEYAVLRGYDRS